MPTALFQDLDAPASIGMEESLLGLGRDLGVPSASTDLPVGQVEADRIAGVFPEIAGMRIKGAGGAHEGLAAGAVATFP